MPWETSAAGDRLRGEIVRFIAEHHRRLGYAPTLREVAAAVGRHPATVIGHLHRLRKAGWVRWKDATPRSLTVTEPV